MQPAVIRFHVAGNVFHLDRLAVHRGVVLHERAVRHVLTHHSGELIGRQLVLQMIDLVDQQRFFTVVHDAGVVPVEHRVWALVRTVGRAFDAVLIDHCLQTLLVKRRPARWVQCTWCGRGRGGLR
ncbi:hypothetical protein D3C84_717160 [compost metagenome]